MSRIDMLTGKRANVANSRSHSNQATKRPQYVNLQATHMGGLKMRVSARTLKTIRRITEELTGARPTLKAKRAAVKAARIAKK